MLRKRHFKAIKNRGHSNEIPFFLSTGRAMPRGPSLSKTKLGC